MTTLSLEKITKSYAQTPVLLDVNIDVNSGEFLVLLGPSGCGKSTLLHVIGGLAQATSGRVLLDGNDAVRARTLVLATGVTWRRTAIDGHV